MNSLKFRAWNVQKKRMYYATPYRGYIKSNGSWWGLYNGDDVELANSGFDKIMQFTGLKDKNGKDIYEGDVVKQSYRFQNYDNEEEIIGIVCNNPLGTYVSVEEKGNGEGGHYYWLHILDEPTKQIEVIGNIHDNPELSERKEK